ncbi:MAG: endonuclease-3 [Cellvibrionaceae bacterium]|jgi:endonuclease-3
MYTSNEKTVPHFLKPDYRKEEVQRAAEVIKRLEEKFSTAGCALNYKNPFEMLVVAILLTQSNEQSVNLISGKFFASYPDPKALMNASRVEIETIIRSTGFYRQKAKYLIETARILVEKFDGQLPENLLEITQLPGVARKIGNLIMGELFEFTEGIQVDTHVHRVTDRLGLSSGKITSKVEQELMRMVPQADWVRLPYLLTALANSHCYASRPGCHACPVSDICPSATSDL